MPSKVNTKTLKHELLDGLTATGGLLDATTLVLLSAMPEGAGLTDSVAPGDLTICNFTGYTDRTAITWSSAHRTVDGKDRVVSPSQFYEATGAFQTVVGYALMNSAKDAVRRAVRFEEPIDLNVANTGFTVEPEFVYGE